MGGGGDYANGDANILDQIKMTADTTTRGKINVNTDIPEVLTLLFQKLRVGSNIASSDGPGCLRKANGSITMEVDSSKAETLADEVLANNPSNNKETFYTRAQLLRSTNGLTNSLCSDGTVQLGRSSDATQEELVGKFINLTKASAASNAFHVIVVVQTIKDLGSSNSAGVTIANDKNNDGDISDSNESVSNCKTGTYDPYADQILSTKKILVTVVRDPVDYTFRIKEFEYLDE